MGHISMREVAGLVFAGFFIEFALDLLALVSFVGTWEGTLERK
jgi:hypothetical protein